MGVLTSLSLLILLAISCHSHSIDKRQAVFQDIVRQRTLGNSISQCPCVIHPESRQCITYDSRYQATGAEEAILAFIDLSNGRHRPGIVNSATFACRTVECQHCFALLYYRLQEIGLVSQNYRTVTSVLRRNQINASLCPRFKFPLPPVIPPLPVQQPDYIRSMISAGLSFANIASTAAAPLPRQFNNRNRFRPGPRLQDQQPKPVVSQSQRQQRWDPQTRTWVAAGQQQPQQRQPQQQWSQPQRPQQQWPQQQQQWPQPQQPQVQPQQPIQWNQQPTWNQQPNVNWNQAATAAATAGAVVGSVLDATSRWRQPQPQLSQPQPQPQPLPQPQPQPMQPPFNHNNGWGRPDWGNNGHHWGQGNKPWTNGQGGWNGQGGGRGSSEVGASGGWGGQLGGGVVGQLPFGKRSKRAVPPLIGRRFTIGCTNRGEMALNDDADFLSLCGSCWTWRELPEDYFPRILNELSCQEGDFCLSGWGQCKQQFRNVDVLRRIDGRWVPTVITTATCCDCRVKAGTEIHALVIGDRRRL